MKFLKIEFKIGNSVFKNVYIIMMMAQQRMDIVLFGGDLMDRCKRLVGKHVYQIRNLLRIYWNKQNKKGGYKITMHIFRYYSISRGYI